MPSLRVIHWVIVAALVGLITGAPAAEVGPAPSGPQDAIHEVMAGDNLHLIAGYYYGDARQWERIWDANKPQVKNPNLIERGTYLRIPNALVPGTPYAEFAARAHREAAERATEKAAGTKTEAPPARSAAPTPAPPPPANAPARPSS